MKKLLTLILLILIACLLGGVYGILHDQLTYTISQEYYTKFKFYQFGLSTAGNETIFPNPRFEVCIVGFLATWWIGIPTGVGLGLVGLIHENWKTMLRITSNAFLVTILITLVTGLIGLTYGYLILADKPSVEFENWFIPDNLVDFRHFIMVGSMHNFSYLGGLIGLFGGFIYSALKWKKGRLLTAINLRKKG